MFYMISVIGNIDQPQNPPQETPILSVLIYKMRVDQMTLGSHLILWGLFGFHINKKQPVAVAHTCNPSTLGS